MSNRRSILFFAIGIALMAVVLWAMSYRAKSVVATVRTRMTLSEFDPSNVTGLEIAPVSASSTTSSVSVVSLSRWDGGAWRIVAPFSAEVDGSAVARLVDAVTLAPVSDMLSLDDLRALGHGLADFGLAPARVAITVIAGARRERLLLGGLTPAGSEIYARSEALRNVFTVSTNVYGLVAAGPDALRRLSFVSGTAEDVVGLEFRIPEKPFLKLVKEGGVWRLSLPALAPADAKIADAIVERLVKARPHHFVWPSAKAHGASSEKLRADMLVSYGLDPTSPAAFTATVRRGADAADQIVFGKPAGTNLVYALVQNGGAVVAVDSALADFCRVGETDLRDTRLFPCVDADVRSVTVTAQDSVMYRLVRDSGRVWRLDTPVDIPADQAAAAWLVERVLRLRQTDLAAKGVRVAVSTATTNMPGVVVSSSELEKPGALANLRVKTLTEIDVSAVRRLSVKSSAGIAAVEWDADRSAWNIAPGDVGAETTTRQTNVVVNAAAVKRLLTALARVEASGVEALSATQATFARCGLDNPAFTISVDLSGGAAVHREIMLGGAAPGGGRYAAVGGADAIFIVSRTTVAALTAPFTE